MYCAMADLAGLYQDEGLMRACRTLWEDMVRRRMYITGSIGSSGILERFTTDYDLPNNCNYSETCASIGLALFGKRMAQLTRDASYMDTAERALYNTVLSGIAQDGKSFFYVNPLEVWPDNCMERTSREHVKPEDRLGSGWRAARRILQGRWRLWGNTFTSLTGTPCT